MPTNQPLTSQMLKRTGYRLIGLGFLIAAMIFTLGFLIRSDDMITVGFFVGHGIFAFGVANLARAKGYQGHYCFIVTLLFSLLLGLIVVWLLPDKTKGK